MDKPLLEVRGLKKSFPIISGVFRHQVGSVIAVDGIDFKIGRGEVLGMVGESGCGKSTAARLAVRLIEPTAGEIFFDGEDLLKKNADQMRLFRREVQMVFQDPYASLNPRKSIGDTIGEALIYHKLVKNQQEKVDRIVETLEKVGLQPEAMNRYPHEFSGGQQQRICIGRAIALRPRLIVCDEVVSALDVSVQAQILNLLDQLKKELGLSYLFISHNLSVVRHISDHVVVMDKGKIVESASAEKLFRDPQDPYTKILLAAEPVVDPRLAKGRKEHGNR